MIKLIKNDKLLQVVGTNGTKLLDVTKLLGASFGVNSETAPNPTVSFHNAISAQSYPLSEVLTASNVPFASFAALSAFFNSFINSGSGGSVAFADITGAPTDNLALANKFSEYLRKTAGSGTQTVENDTVFNVPNNFEVFLTGFSQTGKIGLYYELGRDTVQLAGDRLVLDFDNATDTSSMFFWDLVMSLNELTLNANGVTTLNMLGNAYFNTSYGAFNGQGSGIGVGAGITGQGLELYSLGTRNFECVTGIFEGIVNLIAQLFKLNFAEIPETQPTLIFVPAATAGATYGANEQSMLNNLHALANLFLSTYKFFKI